jgi:PAS domain S-box-containing protein
MLDEAPASITVHDTAGRFLFANRQTLRRHGYDSEEEFLAVNLHDLDVPESEALLAERFRRIAEEGEARFEVSHYRKDGTTFPLEVMAKRIVWDGRPAVLSVASDITERKAAEEELRESEARFRTLIEHAPASVLLLRDGHYVYGNPAATVLLGLERPEDVVGLDALATIAPEYREAVRMRMANAASGKSNAMMEMELIRSDGRRLWVLSTSVTLTMQGLPTTLIMGQDATGVREAQRALRESEERFRNLFENLAAGSCLDELIYEHGKVVDYRILDVNPYYERIMGIPRERARNALGSELYGLSEAPFLEDLARVAETGEPARFDAFFEPIGRHLDFTVFCPEPGLFATVFTDVTDRIQIERALQQSQARHERAQQVAHIGHWDLESPAAVPVWSDEVFNILGLEPGTHEPSFPEHEDLVHPEDWPVLRNAVRNGFRDGSSFDLVLRILRPGTEFGWLHIIGEPRRDDHGNVVGMFGTAQDLTALKHAEERLRRSEARNRLLSDVTMEGILIHREGVAVDVNASMARMLGFEREELAGTDFFQFVHPDDQPRVKAKMAEDYAAPYVIRARRRDGSSFPAEVESRDFVAEDGVWRVSAVRDVTDRLAAERALRESEERFSKAFRTSPYAVMITRASDGWILEVNDAFTTITGHSREEAVHSSTLELALWSDPAERADVIAALRQGRSVTNREYLFRHRDGSPIACLFSAQSLNLQGEACVLSSINDVTEQRKDREERDRLQQELIQAQKMEAIGTLAGGIAHDFNNILAAIMGYAELLDAWVGQGDRKIHHAVAEILRATRRARDLVTQILSFSRRQAADIHSIGVSPLVKEAVKMLRSVLPSTVRVEVRAMSGGDTVMADPAQIHQVLMNLATNGWQAMRETGGTLTIEVSLTEDDSAAGAACSELPPGPYVRMTVSDTGPGIPEELLPRIFEPFFTTKGTNEGTGLGLSVVHGIVKRHGGGVAVHSAPGNGATFEVYLPLAKQRAEEPQAEDEAALPRGCERILLVDDEESLLEVMATLLLGLGYHVTTRRNGKDAVELLEARPNGFDLVVTDLTMPQMTGLDVVHALGERAMDLPVILCTGYSERLTPERAAEEGLSAILNKPISNSELAHAVRTALDEHTG